MRDRIEVIAALKRAKTVAIAAHLSPDGDALGSSLGLARALTLAGKEVTVLQTDDIPEHLHYLPGIDRMQKVESLDTPMHFDLFCLVDLGDIPRMGHAVEAMRASDLSVCIDHHRTNERVCDYNYVVPDASSTCEVIADLLFTAGFPVDADAATHLFAGLITDSNRFLYDNARAKAMRIGAELLDRGADANLIYKAEYQNVDRNMIAFQGHMLQNATVLHDGKVIACNVRQEDVAQFHLDLTAADVLVSEMKNIAGVEVAAVLKDKGPNAQKVSFRSKDYYDVSEVAQRFGGGGHLHAAGCTIEASNAEAFQLLLETLQGLF